MVPNKDLFLNLMQPGQWDMSLNPDDATTVHCWEPKRAQIGSAVLWMERMAYFLSAVHQHAAGQSWPSASARSTNWAVSTLI